MGKNVINFVSGFAIFISVFLSIFLFKCIHGKDPGILSLEAMTIFCSLTVVFVRYIYIRKYC